MKQHPSNYEKNKVYGDMVWVLVIIISLCSLASTCNGQISLQMRSGYMFKTKEPFVSPAINFGAYGLALSPEMIVCYKDNSPAYFGVKMSYQYKFIQAGYGRYFTLFSTDDYDKFKNGWSNMFFVSAHWKKFFLEYDYLNGNVLSIGFKENIGGLQ